ncbi:MAG: oligosaccharide flippase family protein [Pseudomonadota bacterium]
MNLHLLRNAGANLMGAVVPALVALGTVPLVVRGLGEAGYGLFALVSAIAGYFAVIDINLTAGSVKYIAEYSARKDAARVAETVCFGLAVYAVLGVAGALGLYLGAPALVRHLFQVPPALRGLATAALRVAALGFLAGQLQAYLQSVPQALMRYDLSSRFEILFGIVVPLSTVALLLLGYGLVELLSLRVAASALHGALLWHGIRRLLPAWRWRWPGRAERRGLLGFSGYAFLARLAALSYAYADKLIIGALAGVSALAWFSVAATLANRVLGLSFRLSGVFFPAASALCASGELAQLNRLYLGATRYVAFLNAAMLVLLAVFAQPILRYWMDPEFARHGALVLALMAASQFVDALTNLPTLVNDGMGHPRVSGLFALARAGAGLLIVYAGVARAGIEGAAWGHLLASLLFTAAFLAYVHGRSVPASLGHLFARSYAPALGGPAAIALVAALAERYLDHGALDFVLLAGATALLLAMHGLWFVADKQDRAQAWARLRGRPA